MRTLYQQDYSGFTIKHFHEKLEQRHGYKLGYTTTQAVPAEDRHGTAGAEARRASAQAPPAGRCAA